MDIGGTAKKIQRATKVAEESYKKMNEMMGKLQALQEDLATTSKQVDAIEYDLAEQRALLEALAEEQGLDVETVIEAADLPDHPAEAADEPDPAKMATSRPSVSNDED